MLIIKYFKGATASLFLFFLFTSLISCKSTQISNGYFENIVKDTALVAASMPLHESKIVTGDLLGLNFKSLSADDNALFNIPASANGAAQGFLVAENGTIKVNRIGEVRAVGLTRKELGLLLEQQVKPYLKDPVVEVIFLNHHVTVMGEVRAPKLINIPEDRITLIDALVNSGDINENGQKNDVMVIRETEGKKIFKRINLKDHSVFSSDWFYLRPNDVVYVKTDIEKVKREEKRRSFQNNISLIISGVSLLIIILDRLLRL